MKVLYKAIIGTTSALAVSGGIATGVVFALKEDDEPKGPSFSREAFDRMMNFSKNHENVLYLYSDEVNNIDALDIVQSDPYLSNKLKDFVDYNVFSPARITSVGQIGIVGGGSFTPYKKLNSDAYKQADMKTFIDKAYEQTFKTYGDFDQSLLSLHNFGYFNNKVFAHSSSTEARAYVANRSVPKDKNHIDISDYTEIAEFMKGNFNETRVRTDGTTSDDSAVNHILDEYLTSSDTGRPTFKALFTEKTHTKYAVEEIDKIQMPASIKAMPAEKRASWVSTKEALYDFARIIEKLKEMGVYENTTISIISDHGSHQRPIPTLPANKALLAKWDQLNVLMKNSFGEFSDFEGAYRVNPMFMMKMSHTHKAAFSFDDSHVMMNSDAMQMISNHLKTTQHLNIPAISGSEGMTGDSSSIDPLTKERRSINIFNVSWNFTPKANAWQWEDSKFLNFTGTVAQLYNPNLWVPLSLKTGASTLTLQDKWQRLRDTVIYNFDGFVSQLRTQSGVPATSNMADDAIAKGLFKNFYPLILSKLTISKITDFKQLIPFLQAYSPAIESDPLYQLFLHNVA